MSNIKLDQDFYLNFQQLIEDEIPFCSTSEVHGLLTGLICSGEGLHPVETWISLIVTSAELNSHNKRIEDGLTGLMELTRNTLVQSDFNFRPLLPPDDDPLTSRIEGLSDWCHGFTQGLHWNSTIDQLQLDDDVIDAISDINSVAGVEIYSQSGQNEESLIEIEEYLRIATQIIFDSELYKIKKL
tara:strand:- start:53 stop:607 length:555 start_codon:yes stop_codon:yes gene_type:complete